MIVLEVTEDKFGEVMKDISCIEDKLDTIKEVFKAESVNYRKNVHYPYDDREHSYYDRYNSRNRYM